MPLLQSAAELLERVEDVVGAALRESERIFARELASENEYVADILRHTRRFNGKRLRPILLLISAEAAGGIRPAHPVLAAVVEMIHTATLVHDDVLDEADIRRHVATVNVRWNNQTSVLYGDYLFTHAFHLAASLESTLACRLIGRATNRVCEGELSQVRHRGNLELSEDEYYRLVDGKTGELCAVSCRLGAIYAGADEKRTESAHRYGLLLGRAFQITDDVLDLVGIEAAAGKTLGTDFGQGKMTLPLIRLLATARPHERRDLAANLQQANEASRRFIVGQCKKRGLITESLQKAREFAAEARQVLEVFAPSRARDLLTEMTSLATERSC